MSDTLLRVEGLKKFFHVRRGFPVTKTVTVRAVDGISFNVKRSTGNNIMRVWMIMKLPSPSMQYSHKT